jgi:hypothetical protein
MRALERGRRASRPPRQQRRRRRTRSRPRAKTAALASSCRCRSRRTPPQCRACISSSSKRYSSARIGSSRRASASAGSRSITTYGVLSARSCTFRRIQLHQHSSPTARSLAALAVGKTKLVLGSSARLRRRRRRRSRCRHRQRRSSISASSWFASSSPRDGSLMRTINIVALGEDTSWPPPPRLPWRHAALLPHFTRASLGVGHQTPRSAVIARCRVAEQRDASGAAAWPFASRTLKLEISRNRNQSKSQQSWSAAVAAPTATSFLVSAVKVDVALRSSLESISSSSPVILNIEHSCEHYRHRHHRHRCRHCA